MSDRCTCICDDCLQTARHREIIEADEDQEIASWDDNDGMRVDNLTLLGGSGRRWMIKHWDDDAQVDVDGRDGHEANCPSMHAALAYIAEHEEIDPAALIGSMLHSTDTGIAAVARLQLPRFRPNKEHRS